jgi:hypothetical protein
MPRPFSETLDTPAVQTTTYIAREADSLITPDYPRATVSALLSAR